MLLPLFARRFAVLAASVSCLCLVLAVCPLQATPARDWPLYSRAETGKSADGIVRALQYLLRARGYTVTADGIFAKSTDAVVRRFQRAHHLIANGRTLPPTWEALVIRIAPGAS